MAYLSDFINSQLPESYSGNIQTVGIGGFTLDVRVSESVRMENSVSKTWIEDGSAITDHVTTSPTVLQISGQVSDIHFNLPETSQIQRFLNTNIGVISKYLPTRTQSQLNKIQSVLVDAKDVVDKVDDIIADGEQLYNLFGDKTPDLSTTQGFFDAMEAYSRARIPIVVDMPYKTYKNMIITSLTIDTDNQFEPLSYSMTFEEIRLAKITYVENGAKKNPSSGLGGQVDDAINKGKIKPKEIKNESVLSQFLGVLGF